MKQFKLATLAAAGLLATGLAGAGTLQVTPIQYAAETIAAGQPMTAPVFSYALGAPISTASQPVFTFRFTLDKAVWDKTSITVANTYIISNDNTVSLQPDGISYLKADGTASATATDAATVVLTFTMRGINGIVGATAAAPVNPNYTFAQGANIVIGTAALPPKALGTSAMAAPANVCVGGVEDVVLSVAMFNAIGAETAESLTGSALNLLRSNTYLRTNAALLVVASTANESSRIDVTSPSLGKQFTNPAGDPTVNVDFINLGSLRVTERGLFKDASSAAGNNYTVEGANFGVDGASAGAADGFVSVRRFSMTVNGMFQAAPATATATSPKVFLSSSNDCASPLDTATGNAGTLATAAATMTGTSATFTNFPTTAAGFPYTLTGTTKARTAWICLQRNNALANSDIIPPAQFSITEGSANQMGHFATESGSPICGSALYNLRQNGVQFDLRNVVARNSPAYTEGWRSFVRVINTDETQTATVFGQVITSAGVVLAGAPIVTLAPRAYRFLSTDQIETSLAGSASAAYAATDGQNYRLRLTAPVASLRAQNWLLNPATGNFIEASGAQGDEAPGNAVGLNTVSEDSRK